ncbi:MAG TPA: alpha/beta fold hydrolase [Nocardioidaceae bacterium]|nr:alpha/beta fold hydrolase [Nocardioidaceae bacterium]
MPQTEFTAHAADATLHCVRRGSGAPLLLIMGVAGHQLVWGDAFLERLAEEFEVITYDHRGIGASSRADEFTHDDLVADAVAVLDWAGVVDAHVLGFSMGGTIAQRLAIEHPERLRTLTLVATWPDLQDVFGEGVLSFAAAGQAPDPETATWILFEANFSKAFAENDENFKRFLAAASAAKVPAPVAMGQVAASATHDVSDKLEAVDVPTLVVHGTQDAIINASAGERLADAIPGAKLELWPGLGHHLSWEASERLAQSVIDHVKAAD